MAGKRLATSTMAVRGVLTVCLLMVSVVFGVGAWYAPVLLHGIADGDWQLHAMWIIGYLWLVMMSGGSLIAIWAIWND